MWRRVLTLAIAAAVIAVAGGSSATGGVARSAAADLSTRQGAVSYLRSLGLSPDGFVVQRGTRNYAGPKCPGKGWTCTSSTRVLQISTALSGTNDSNCGSGSDLSNPAGYSCVIVQMGTTGANVATCRLTTNDGDSLPSSPATISQSCSIFQQIDPNGKKGGRNTATVEQTIVQGGTRTCGLIGSQQQCASQTATIRQLNARAAGTATGPNEAFVKQSIVQGLAAPAAAPVGQAQSGAMSFDIRQNYPQDDTTFDPASCLNIQGTNTASVTQAVTQNEDAGAQTSGSQFQNSYLDGHVNQCSNSTSSYTVTQEERQTQTPNESRPGITRTQLGPAQMGCCSFQGTHPSDTCSITQNTNQQSPGAVQVESILSRAVTSGSCTKSATIVQNGVTRTATSASAAHDDGLTCLGGGNCGTDKPASLLTALSPAASAILPNTTLDYGDTVRLSATLSQAGTPLKGLPVVLSVDGAAAETCAAFTDGAGVASCTVTLGDTPGSHSVGATFAGAGPYASSSANATFTVSKETTSLAYSPVGATTITKDRSGFVTLTARLTEDGNALPGKTVSFTKNGAAATCESAAFTGTNGVASCRTQAPPGNSVTVIGAYAGDVNFVGSSFAAVTLTYTR